LPVREDGRVATYYDEHAELEVVQRRRGAVLGEGPDALVHANALRDAGVDVRIGATTDAPVRELAETVGIAAVDIAEAVAAADLVIVVDTDPTACERFAAEALPALHDGTAIVVVDPIVLRFGLLPVPDGHDVMMIQPLAPSALVEDELAAGRGVPVLLAVHQDATTGAHELALSYAKAIGGTRAGAIGTTVAAAAETSVFGEYGVAGGVLEGLISAGFDTLVEAGYPRDMAYLACVHSLRGALERAAMDDAAGRSEGTLREYARRTGGAKLADQHLRWVLRRALEDVQEGTLAAEFLADHDAGSPQLIELRATADRHPAVATGRRVRRLLPWIATTSADARHAR
jgi:ketol-acid reductoisomerase